LRAGGAFVILLAYELGQLVTAFGFGFVAGLVLALGRANLHDPDTLARFTRASEAPAAVLGAVVGGLVVVRLVRFMAHEPLRSRSANGIAWGWGAVSDLALGGIVGGLLGISYLLGARLLTPPDAGHSLGPMVRMATTPGFPRLCWVLLALVVAPPIEELLFRGVLFAGFSRSWGRPVGAVVTTVLFVLMHAPAILWYWPTALVFTLLGAFALALRLRAGALGPAVALHVAYNLVLVLAVYRAEGLVHV
jgi:membrane protease YdiL (CAAX protease family)